MESLFVCGAQRNVWRCKQKTARFKYLTWKKKSLKEKMQLKIKFS